MEKLTAPSELTEKLREAAQSAPGGVLPFETFMERALYEPGLGYYERSPSQVGRTGDFYTSVSVGPLFGELLAHRFSKWLSELGDPPCLVEAGAHDGRLASDILSWFQHHRPALLESLTYCLVEPSAVRRQWQADRLSQFGSYLKWSSTLPATRGIIFSNELLDAFPVRPVRWNRNAQRWLEIGVAWETGRFVEVVFPPRLDTTTPDLPELLLAALPDGFTTEYSTAAEAWWGQAADSLAAGYLIAIDYGLSDQEFLVPQRQGGTRRGYRRHHFISDLLADPGECDLTAHVNFSRLQSVGEGRELQTMEFAEQRRWLTAILQETLEDSGGFGAWTPDRRRQFQTLTHPEHLGRSFRWLVQYRPTITEKNVRAARSTKSWT